MDASKNEVEELLSLFLWSCKLASLLERLTCTLLALLWLLLLLVLEVAVLLPSMPSSGACRLMNSVISLDRSFLMERMISPASGLRIAKNKGLIDLFT